MTVHTIQSQQQQNKLQDKLYLLDQNIRDYHIGTRPTKYFQPLHLALPQNSTDKEVLSNAVENNKIILTCDRLFAIENLISNRTVIFQDNYGIRYYLKVKNSFVFDFIQYDSVDTFPLYKKQTILHKIKRIIKIQKPTTQNNYSYLLDFHINNNGFTRSKNRCAYASRIFSIALSRKNHNEQIKYVLSYAIQNNLTIITKSKFLCILSLIKTKRCIFEDQYGTRHYITLHDAFEFERVSLVKKDVIPSRNGTIKKDDLQYNTSQIRESLEYINRNLNYIESELLQRKELEALKQLEPLQVPVSNPNKGIDTFE